jgi:hypothetical protein
MSFCCGVMKERMSSPGFFEIPVNNMSDTYSIRRPQIIVHKLLIAEGHVNNNNKKSSAICSFLHIITRLTARGSSIRQSKQAAKKKVWWLDHLSPAGGSDGLLLLLSARGFSPWVGWPVPTVAEKVIGRRYTTEKAPPGIPWLGRWRPI